MPSWPWVSNVGKYFWLGDCGPAALPLHYALRGGRRHHKGLTGKDPAGSGTRVVDEATLMCLVGADSTALLETDAKGRTALHVAFESSLVSGDNNNDSSMLCRKRPSSR